MVRTSMVPMLLVCCGLAAQVPGTAEVKRLSLQDALRTSLQNNLQVDIAQQARDTTRAQVLINQGPFDWNLSAEAQVQRLDSASTGSLSKVSGGTYQELATTYNRTLTTDLTKAFEWGGSVDLGYAPVYAYSRGVYNDYPSAGTSTAWTTARPYSGAFTATYSQNLLLGFGREVTTAPLVIAQKGVESADYTFRLAIINLMAATESQYWDVVYAGKNLENYQTALRLAQKQLADNNIRLKVGTMAPLDVTSAEAQVAKAEQDIITGQAALDNAKDTLIRALYPNAERPAGLELTDTPPLSYPSMDEASAVKMALERRVELKSARINKDINDLQLKVARNKLLPSLKASIAYNGATDSYGSIGSVNSDLTGMNYPGYTVGLAFSMPLQNRAAKGGLAVARANLRSSELTLRDQELSITLDVRKAVRNVESMEKGVKAAEKTRYLQEKTLEAEQKKFENGMSTNFNVLQDMTNLDNARSAESQAQINYANAITALEQALGNLLEARNFTIK